MTPVEEAWLRLQLLLGEHRDVEARHVLACESIAFHTERAEAAAAVHRGR